MRTKIVALEKIPGLSLSQPGPEEEASPSKARAQARLLQTAIAQELTPRQRQCVELYYFRQLTMEETGRQLGIGKATVCRHLQKSRDRLARALSYANLTP